MTSVPDYRPIVGGGAGKLWLKRGVLSAIGDSVIETSFMRLWQTRQYCCVKEGGPWVTVSHSTRAIKYSSPAAIFHSSSVHTSSSSHHAHYARGLFPVKRTSGVYFSDSG